MASAAQPGFPGVAVVLLFLTAHAPSLAGQSVVMGDVVERSTAEPLRGVFVAVVDDAGRRIAGVLTDDGGRFRIGIPAPGTYTLSAERIGFAPVRSDALELGASPVTYRFELDSRPIQLEGMVVEAEERQCKVRSGEGSRLQAIWEQARTALDVAAWTERAGGLRSRQRTYERWVDPVSGRVREEVARGRQLYGRVGFAAAPPEEVVTAGFVQPEPDSEGYVFHGLDAATIQSEVFLDAHCFQIRAPPQGGDGLVGLAFEPVGGRAVPGVRGVLWLDEATAALRSLEYSYTWLPWALPLEPFGGEASFRRLPGGMWIVESWTIRMPDVERVPPDLTWSRLPRRDVLARLRSEAGLLIKEEGGEVTSLRTADGLRLPGPQRAALHGAVYDSIGNVPLEGARVRLDGTGHEALTDDQGRYRMDDLPAGTYVVTFEHPLVESWDVAAVGAEVTLRRGELAVGDLAVPSLATVLGLGCRDAEGEAGAGAGQSMVVGRVLASRTGDPVGGAHVSLRLAGQGPEDALDAWTDASGVYRFCALPGLGAGQLSAAYLGRGRAEVAVDIPDAGPVFKELRLRLDAPSRVVGQVVDVETGQPVAGVTLRLARTAGERVTGRDGRFVFPAVEPGRHDFAARHVAYETVEDALDVDGTGRTLHVEVRVAVGAIALDPIIATAERRPMSGVLRAVYDRIDRVRLIGGGTVFDRGDIERRNPRNVTHLVGEVQGVDVWTYRRAPFLSSSRAFSGWNPVCLMTVWIDGAMVMQGGMAGTRDELVFTHAPTNINELISVSEIEAIEVYHPSDRIPAQYWGSNAGCGVVLIWSRRET